MNKGYVILAQNTHEIDYVGCAEALALSIKKAMPESNITLISDIKAIVQPSITLLHYRTEI